MARSISARNFSRRVTLRLAWNSASEKLNWLIGGFLIGSRSTTYILTGPADLFRPSLGIREVIGMPHDVSNVFFADCAARSFFDQVANKWSVMILSVLSEKPTRFNEIRRRLEGVTHKALTQALRRLERNGLIARHVLATS